MNPQLRRPLIFDIHRYALDDGPGIRTTVFFKGCPLRCIWCHNPEGIASGPELFHQARKCIGCGDCISACPKGAISLNGSLQIDRAVCDGCGRCAARCPSRAMSIKGYYDEPDALVEKLMIDEPFYRCSRGGVTFSGGEPTRHLDYLSRVARNLKSRQIHTALQTCGQFSWQHFASELLPWIDLIFFDVKLMDARRHRGLTGQSNRNILSNFSRLVNTARAKLICTVPLITGLNTDAENLNAIASTIGEIENLPYRLYPYHPGGAVKCMALGRSVAPQFSRHAMAPDEYRLIADSFDAVVNTLRRRNREAFF